MRDKLIEIIENGERQDFYEQNIGVYNHIRKELDDLTEYAEKLGVEL